MVKMSRRRKWSAPWASTWPEALRLHIMRFLNLTGPQFRGCLSAFVDSLFGELNSASMYLRKLENQPKGAAFAYEMSLDRHRYGALMVLDRWATLVKTFGAYLESAPDLDLAAHTPARVQTAGDILERANQLIDA